MQTKLSEVTSELNALKLEQKYNASKKYSSQETVYAPGASALQRKGLTPLPTMENPMAKKQDSMGDMIYGYKGRDLTDKYIQNKMKLHCHWYNIDLDQFETNEKRLMRMSLW
jgi:hypothetical protein